VRNLFSASNHRFGLLKRKLGEFGDRTLGELVGFTDQDKIWDRGLFDAVVERPIRMVIGYSTYLKAS
jgi:hypothetical protein